MRVEVTGLDGTDVSDSATFRVLNAPPTIRLIDAPTRAVVGRPVRVSFKVSGGVDERVAISTRSGIVFSRAFLIRDGIGDVKWTPTSSGWADLLIRAHGHQGQTASASLRLTVEPRPPAVTPPTVTLLKVPEHATVGRASTVRFRASDCDEALARIEAPGEETRIWRFPCPAPRARSPGRRPAPAATCSSAIAHGDGTTAQATHRADRGAVPMTSARSGTAEDIRVAVPVVRRRRLRDLRGGRPPSPSRPSGASRDGRTRSRPDRGFVHACLGGGRRGIGVLRRLRPRCRRARHRVARVHHRGSLRLHPVRRARHSQPDRCHRLLLTGAIGASAPRRLHGTKPWPVGPTARARRRPPARARNPADHRALRHPCRGPGKPDDLRRGHPHRPLRAVRQARAGHARRRAGCRRSCGRLLSLPPAYRRLLDHGADRPASSRCHHDREPVRRCSPPDRYQSRSGSLPAHPVGGACSHRGPRVRRRLNSRHQPSTGPRTGPVPRFFRQPVDLGYGCSFPWRTRPGAGGSRCPWLLESSWRSASPSRSRSSSSLPSQRCDPNASMPISCSASSSSSSIYPSPFIRFAATFVLLVFAIDLLIARRHFVRPLLRSGFGWRRIRT